MEQHRVTNNLTLSFRGCKTIYYLGSLEERSDEATHIWGIVVPHTTSNCAGRLPLPPEQVVGSPLPLSSADYSAELSIAILKGRLMMLWQACSLLDVSCWQSIPFPEHACSLQKPGGPVSFALGLKPFQRVFSDSPRGCSQYVSSKSSTLIARSMRHLTSQLQA